MRVLEVLQNHLLDAVDVREDIVIPETNDAPAAPLEPRGPPFIVRVAGVLTAVGFDDQAAFEADEIDDERAEAMLAAEFEAAQAPVAKRTPKTPFRVGCIDTELARALIGYPPSPSQP